ncbi:GumC family protein [Sphingomonas sp. ac-8]|uniref:GumC family protein n=1 Tax=Sphingomonas sp. ac-8 TaxID=3242977 RepID=UPI003A80BB0A
MPRTVAAPFRIPAAASERDASLRFDLAALLTALRRNAALVAAILAAALVGGLVLTLATPPGYVATARIQIDQEGDRVLDGAEVERQADAGDAERFLQTQTDVLRSRSLSIRVAERLALFDGNGFFAAMRAPLPEGSAVRRREATLRLLQAHLTVDLPRDSRVASLSFASSDPALAATIANAYAAAFIEANLQRKFDSSAYARRFLSGQLAKAKDRVERSERALNRYARAARLIRTQPSADGSLGSVTTASLAQLNLAANEARAGRIAAEQKWRSVEAASAMAIPDVLTNLAVQRLVEQRAAGAAELQRERARHLNDHPTVRQLVSQQAELDRQIADLAAAIRESIRGSYRDALGRERALMEQVDGLKGATLAEQDRGVRYTLLAREAETNRTLYHGLLQRYRELSAAAGITTNNISVIDVAEPPLVPESPRLALNLLVALAAGLVIAAAALFVREQRDDGLRTPDDIERKLGLPLLGAVPITATGSVLDAVDTPRTPLNEAYASLCAALLHASPHGLPRTIVVTSASAGEGKSTSSYAIAAGLARLGRKVALVDADLRRPSLHRMLDLPGRSGLTNLLVREATLDQALQPLRRRGLAVLAAGPASESPAESLGSARMAEVMATLTARFDTVVLDAPPVLGLADAPMLASQAEATILVVAANQRDGGAAEAALRRLHGVRASVLGVVLTKFDTRRAGQGYRGYYDYGAAEAPRAAAE